MEMLLPLLNACCSAGERSFIWLAKACWKAGLGTRIVGALWMFLSDFYSRIREGNKYLHIRCRGRLHNKARDDNRGYPLYPVNYILE